MKNRTGSGDGARRASSTQRRGYAREASLQARPGLLRVPDSEGPPRQDEASLAFQRETRRLMRALLR